MHCMACMHYAVCAERAIRVESREPKAELGLNREGRAADEPQPRLEAAPTRRDAKRTAQSASPRRAFCAFCAPSVHGAFAFRLSKGPNWSDRIGSAGAPMLVFGHQTPDTRHQGLRAIRRNIFDFWFSTRPAAFSVSSNLPSVCC